MNIQVATSELPVTSVRGGPRLSGTNYTQRPQTRFRGNRGTGSVRGNLLIRFNYAINLYNNKIDSAFIMWKLFFIINAYVVIIY